MTLGQKIKAARLTQNMTQKELVGDYITRNMLSKIENDSATPSVRTLEFLAGALGLPTGYFLSDAVISDGTVPDGLDDARAAFRARRWGDCLAALELDKKAGTSDEGYLLHAYAGAYAARAALDEGDCAAARELAEAAQYYNQEGMYANETLAADLALVLGTALTRLGEEGYEEQRTGFLRTFRRMEAEHGGGISNH
ncbi:MAG: helix-turn-helix transcriptional regulator [Pseudoflavonifractor sp.]